MTSIVCKQTSAFATLSSNNSFNLLLSSAAMSLYLPPLLPPPPPLPLRVVLVGVLGLAPPVPIGRGVKSDDAVD